MAWSVSCEAEKGAVRSGCGGVSVEERTERDGERNGKGRGKQREVRKESDEMNEDLL